MPNELQAGRTRSPRSGGGLSPWLWVLPLAACVIGGCTSNAWKRRVVYSFAGVSLYTERLPGGPEELQPDFSHPLDLPLETWKTLLSRLGYLEGSFLGIKGSKVKPLFSADEVKRLAVPLRLAMQSVGAKERIRFLVSKSNWSEIFLGASGTAGVVFQSQPGTLNIAVDYLHEDLIGADQGNPSQITFRVDPTETVDASPLVPGYGARLHVGAAGEEYPRWVEIDLATLPSPETPATEEPATEEGETPKDPPSETTGEDGRYREVRSQVELLQRLRDEGVISQEEYDKGLQRLLTESEKRPDGS